MKQFIQYIYVFFPLLCLHGLAIGTTSASYTLTVQMPKNSINLTKKKELSLPGLKAYYKGTKIDLSKGCGKVPEPEPGESVKKYFSLIITPDIELSCSRQDNSVKYLKRVPSSPILWFDATLSLTITDEQGKKLTDPYYSWTIEERSTDELPDRLPEQALIILIEPKLITRIQATKQSCEEPLLLPSIVFDDSVSTETLQNALTYAAISSIDLDTVHTPAQEMFTKTRVREIAQTAALAE